MIKAKVRRLVIPAGHRILAVSDIHGNPVFLRELLRKVAFGAEDYLFLLGDMVEKGEESLATLRMVMDLCAQYPHVYPICGNCDEIANQFTDEAGEIDPAFYDMYFRLWKGKSLVLQMGREAGCAVRGREDYPALRAALRRDFQPELQFIRALPTIIETQNFLFVHGGVPREDRLEELEAWRCMKNDFFLEQGHSFQKWCVVGHSPVTLYHAHIPSAQPIIQRQRRIISIDGGCSLKVDGQLNALIIPGADGEDFSSAYFDGLPTAEALDGQAPSEDSVNIRWGKNQLEVLERGPERSLCRHCETGRVLEILTEYLYERGGTTRCEDSTDYRLPVSPGDRLSVVRRISGGALAKKDGVTGWYFGRLGPGGGPC